MFSDFSRFVILSPVYSLEYTHFLIGMYLLYLSIVVRIDVSPDLLCALVLVTRRLA